MSRRQFDARFGATLMESLPTGPGVYLFRDAVGDVIYVGKATNLRRRLQQYRNAGRRKVHRKMRTLVREAGSLEIRPLASERAALLEENALIRHLRPRHNVDGAFTFLYPGIGLGRADGVTLLCFSTKPETYCELGLHWCGVFRSRARAREAFDALVDVLALVGHLAKRTELPARRSVRGSRLVGLRQLSPEWSDRLLLFLRGGDRGLLVELATALLDKPGARRRAAWVEERLRVLDRFHASDLRPLRLALERQGRTDGWVSQDDRDTLFIEVRPDIGDG